MLDLRALETGRLARVRRALERAECVAVVFYDPVNIRYATGARNMAVYSLHNPCRYAVVPVSGPVVLFEFKACEHLAEGHAVVDEVRPASAWYHFAAGPSTTEVVKRWADELADLVGAHRIVGPRVAFDRLDPAGLEALHERGISVCDGQAIVEGARVIKTPQEITAMRLAVAACERAIDRMAEHLVPGITEQALWAQLHAANIELGGEWIETRLLTSGPRTNPWYQECSERVIADGDLVAFDTDLIGVHGYSVDVSRTWIAGERNPTDEQRCLYAAAHEQVTENTELLVPGATFQEIADKAHRLGDRYESPANAAIAHGTGLCNEYPLLVHREYLEANGYDGVVEPGMVLCVESYAGEPGGREGVKLEQQILVTDDGPELLSTYPFASELL